MPKTLTPQIALAAIAGLELQKTQIDSQIADLRSLLDGDRTESTATPSEAGTRKRKKFSLASRRKMAAAQKARWAGINKAKPSQSDTSEASKPRRKFSAATRRKMAATQKSEPMQAVTAKPKRKMSATGRKAISEATKKRWAAVKSAQKAG
jgi:hypothetical protein